VDALGTAAEGLAGAPGVPEESAPSPWRATGVAPTEADTSPGEAEWAGAAPVGRPAGKSLCNGPIGAATTSVASRNSNSSMVRRRKAVSSKMTCLEIMIVRGGEGSGILYDKQTNPKRRIGRIEARVCGRLWQTGWCNTCSQKCEGDHTPEVCPREQGAAWRTLGSWSEMLTRRSS